MVLSFFVLDNWTNSFISLLSNFFLDLTRSFLGKPYYTKYLSHNVSAVAMLAERVLQRLVQIL